ARQLSVFARVCGSTDMPERRAGGRRQLCQGLDQEIESLPGLELTNRKNARALVASCFQRPEDRRVYAEIDDFSRASVNPPDIVRGKPGVCQQAPRAARARAVDAAQSAAVQADQRINSVGSLAPAFVQVGAWDRGLVKL